MSFLSQCRHRTVIASLILWSLSLVGSMSWRTRYHIVFVVPGTGAVGKFFQTVAQSVFGQRRVMRMSGGSVVSRKRE
jgi:hypothetical protein